MGAARELLSQTFNKWLEDRAERLGAALAFYAALSIAPMLIIILSIVSFFYAGVTLDGIREQIAHVIGPYAADAAVATIGSARANGGAGAAAIVSAIALLFGATLLFAQLQDAMNTIWEVRPKSRRVWAEILRTRLLSFAMVLVVCFLLVVSLVISTVLAAITEYFSNLVPGTARLLPTVDFLVTFVMTTILFAAIYKILPDVHIAWRDVWTGAAVTSALFTAGKIFIGFYLARSGITSAYGAASSLMVLLLWVYFSAQLLFLGAEFTRVYADRYGRQVHPARGAISFDEYFRIRQGIPHREVIEQVEKKHIA